MRLCWKINTTSTSNQHHQQTFDMRLCWKINTTNTPNHHHQQPFDMRLCWKIRTTSTPKQHHQQPFELRLCWKTNTTSTSNQHHRHLPLDRHGIGVLQTPLKLQWSPYFKSAHGSMKMWSYTASGFK